MFFVFGQRFLDWVRTRIHIISFEPGFNRVQYLIFHKCYISLLVNFDPPSNMNFIGFQNKEIYCIKDCFYLVHCRTSKLHLNQRKAKQTVFYRHDNSSSIVKWINGYSINRSIRCNISLITINSNNLAHVITKCSILLILIKNA